MKKSKFLSALKQLDVEELADFGQFLKLYHRKDKTALRVFRYVQAFNPDFDSNALSTDQVYLKIYKEQLPEAPSAVRNTKVKKLLNKFSELSLWLKDFLWYQKISTPSVERDLIWSTILMERKMDRELKKHRLSLKEAIKSTLPTDVPGYLNQMLASYLTNYVSANQAGEKVQNSIPNFIENLDSFYAVTRLKLACVIETHKFLKGEINPDTASAFPLNSLMAIVSSSQIQNNPLIAIYLEMLILIINANKNNYGKVKAMLKENLDCIAPGERFEILVALQNYAAIQIRLGNREFMGLAHDMNVFGVENGFFTKDGIISANYYTSIINTACKESAWDWVQNFAVEYAPQLPPDIQEKVSKLGKAIILFEKGNYSDVISTLQGLVFSDPHSEIRSRSMILMSNQELKEDIRYLLPYCHAFEQYLMNRYKKDKSDIINASLNFVRTSKKIIIGTKDKAELIAEIQSFKLLYYRTWLLRQAGLL